jgi:hypothetical protein
MTSLKITKGLAEVDVNRKTDNIMTKIKKDNRTKADLQNTIQIEQSDHVLYVFICPFVLSLYCLSFVDLLIYGF